MTREVFDVKAFGEDPLWGAFRKRLFSEQSELPSTTVAPNLELLQTELETVCEQLLRKLDVRKSDHDALCMASQTSLPDRRLLSIALLKEKLLGIKAKLNKNSLVLLLKFKQQLERIFQVLGKEDAWGPPTVTIATAVSSGAGGRRPFIKRANPGRVDAALFDFSAGGAGWGIYQLELDLIKVAALKFSEARLLMEEDFARVQSEISELQSKLKDNYNPQKMIKGIQKLGFELEQAAQSQIGLVREKLGALEDDIFKPYEKLSSYSFFMEELTRAKGGIKDFFSKSDLVVKPCYYFACQMLPLIHQDISVRHLVLFELNMQSQLIEYMQSKIEKYSLGEDILALPLETLGGLFGKYSNVDFLSQDQIEELVSFNNSLTQLYDDLRRRVGELNAQHETEKRYSLEEGPQASEKLAGLELQYQDLLKKQPQPGWASFPIFEEFENFVVQSRQGIDSAEKFLRSSENFRVCFQLMSSFFNGLNEVRRIEALFAVNKSIEACDPIIYRLRAASRLFRMEVKELHYPQYFDESGCSVSSPIREKPYESVYYLWFYQDNARKLQLPRQKELPLFARSSESMAETISGDRQKERIKQDLEAIHAVLNVPAIIIDTIENLELPTQNRYLSEIQPALYKHIVLPFLKDKLSREHPVFSQYREYFDGVFQAEPGLSDQLKVMMFWVFYQVCAGQGHLDNLITQAAQVVMPLAQQESAILAMQRLIQYYAQQSGCPQAGAFISQPHSLQLAYGVLGRLSQRLSGLKAGTFAAYSKDLQGKINGLQWQLSGLIQMFLVAQQDPNSKAGTLLALFEASKQAFEALERELASAPVVSSP